MMLSYLLELRQRLIRIIMVFGVLFLLCYYFANPLFHVVVSPLLKALPSGQKLIATHIVATVFTPLKLAADLALLLTMPFALLQIWQFVAPALYQRERDKMRIPVLISLGLFVVGMLFCYFLILPMMFQFFTASLPNDVQMMPDITYSLDFITRMLLIFGWCFQIPLIAVLLVHWNVMSLQTLLDARPYVIVAAFIIGMLLTPPDVLSQVLLAVPLCLLYESSILLLRWLYKEKARENQQA